MEKSTTFAFRCDWEDEKHISDGSTYAIDKRDLKNEIVRRSRVCNDRPSVIRVVKVKFELWEIIKKQSSKVYSTTQGFHESDLSRS